MGSLVVDGQIIDVTLGVGPSNGSSPVQEVNFSGSVTIIYDLQNGTNLQFVTRASDPAAAYLDELATDVWLLGDIGTARFRAWAVWQEWFANGQDNVNCMAVTYKKMLGRRHVVGAAGLTFTNTDIGQIIWGLWQHTQAQPGGNLGITLGTPNLTGLIRTREYKQGENLGSQAEAEFEEGVWWNVDADLVYHAYTFDNGTWLATPLQLATNCRTMQRAAGSDFANAVFGDADDEHTTGVWATASDLTTDPRGRWELASGWPTVTLQQTLVDRTNAFLKQSNIPVAHWNLELEPGRWINDARIMPGMFAVLVVPPTLAAPIGTPTNAIVVFVTQLSVNYDEDGQVTVKAVVMERPDKALPTTAIVPSTFPIGSIGV